MNSLPDIIFDTKRRDLSNSNAQFVAWEKFVIKQFYVGIPPPGLPPTSFITGYLLGQTDVSNRVHVVSQTESAYVLQMKPSPSPNGDKDESVDVLKGTFIGTYTDKIQWEWEGTKDTKAQGEKSAFLVGDFDVDFDTKRKVIGDPNSQFEGWKKLTVRERYIGLPPDNTIILGYLLGKSDISKRVHVVYESKDEQIMVLHMLPSPLPDGDRDEYYIAVDFRNRTFTGTYVSKNAYQWEGTGKIKPQAPMAK